MNQKTVIFDLDGTLVDNMHIHFEAFTRFNERHDLPPITHEMRANIDGKRNRDIFPILYGRALEDAELRAHAAEKEGIYREISRGRLAPLRGLVDFLGWLDANGRRYGIATSAPAPNVPHTLDEAGLSRHFEISVRSDEVERGKPFPDVFLEAARRLEAEPSECIVFEDSPAGINAATEAGMACVGLTTSFTRKELERHSTPSMVVADYVEFTELTIKAAL